MFINLIFLFSLFLLLLYTGILLSIKKTWKNYKSYSIPKSQEFKTSVSIIIAARNEEKNIQTCIQSILDNDYKDSLYELIIVNDHSEDNTVRIVENFISTHVQLYSLDNKIYGKKQALSKGIASCKGDLIITTDADCIVGKKWISSIVSFFESNNPDLIVASVNIPNPTNWLTQYQTLDLNGMMGVTAYGIIKNKFYLANGANMAFKKSTFYDVNAYQGNIHIASGDDLFLIHKIAKQENSKILFLKSIDATVSTQAEEKLSSLINQRKRWATKSTFYSDRGLKLLLGIIFSCNLMVFIIPLFIFIFFTSNWIFSIVIIGIKLIVDYNYLRLITDYYHSKKALNSFIPASLLSSIIIIYSGLVGIFPSKYKWKNRSVS